MADKASRATVEICLGFHLRARWREGRPSSAELSALRRIFPELMGVGMVELRRQFSDGSAFTSDLRPLGEGRELAAKASALGLDLELVKEHASIDDDRHTWIADGSNTAFFTTGPGVNAIGWLSPAHPYPRGRAPSWLASRLYHLVAARAWLPFAAAGVHTCGFCGSAHGAQAILVPDGPVLHVAPDLVGHYVEEHDYLPCDAFVKAVMACPAPASPAYFHMLRPFAGLWPDSPMPG
jgi:hypothetical protein